MIELKRLGFFNLMISGMSGMRNLGELRHLQKGSLELRELVASASPD